MMAVIFEVWPAEGRREDYLRLAAELRTHLSTFDGFISVERFESLYEQGKLLCCSSGATSRRSPHGGPTCFIGACKRPAVPRCSGTIACAWQRWSATTA
jgi:hypothetical protein